MKKENTKNQKSQTEEKPSIQHLLTEKETAEFLSISRSTLRHQRQTGSILGQKPCIPYIKIGHLVRYDPKDITMWVEQNRITQGNESAK